MNVESSHDKWNTYLFFTFQVYDIPFWLVKQLIVGSIQFYKDFHKIRKDFNQPLLELIISNVFFKTPAKGYIKYQLGFM